MIKLIILRLKIFISFLICEERLHIENTNAKRIFLFLGADYGNLGDVAITYAQIKYLKEHYPVYSIIEIPISQTLSGIKTVKRNIQKSDVITLIGGGNTSDLYDDIEFLRQLVIWNFRNHKIVGFPQTIFFSDSLKGRLCKRLARYIYSQAKDLTIIARESNSESVLEGSFKGLQYAQAPDVVMTLDKRTSTNRKGLLVCMRSDKEQLIGTDEKNRLIHKLEDKYGPATYRDTETSGVNSDNRFEMLEDLISLFQQKELVLTDRLHGMILAFITGTPALVVDNSNRKISTCYQWIKDCGYIHVVDDCTNFEMPTSVDRFESTHDDILQQYSSLKCLQFQ